MPRRILDAAIQAPEQVTILVDGVAVAAGAGESLAAALLVAGISTLRRSPRAGTPRGAFCLMGICQECLVRVDGRLALACQEPVRAGMTVARDAGA